MSSQVNASSDQEPLEARASLLDLARRKTGTIPAELLVDHVLALYYRDAGWTVTRGAMEALLRRLESGRRDGLRVAERPAGGRPFGRWRTKRPGAGLREWTTLLDSVDPIRGSCDCPDYLRGSLGVCKHLLVALDDVARRPRTWKRAMGDDAEDAVTRSLSWHPVRPLKGPGDWLDQIRFHPRPPGSQRRSLALERAKRQFARDGSGEWKLKTAHRDDPARRLRLVQVLRELTRRRGRGAEPDPAVAALLRDEERRLERVVVDGRDARELVGSLRSLKRKLYPYQRVGVKAFLARGRLLLADDMGLGKTAQAIASCHALFHAGKVRRGLLIVPAALKSQWQREWELFTDVPVAIVEGNPSEREEIYRRQRRGFLIANYEQLLRDAELIETWQPELICLDEAQRIKNWATKTAASVKSLKPAYRLVLTGTPLENRLSELASLMDWVDDHALEPKWRLVPWHAVHADGKKELTGIRDLKSLRQRLAPTLVRRIRKEVLKQLPSRTDTVVPVQLTDIQRGAHDDLSVPIARLVATAARRPLSQPEFFRLMSLLTTQRIIANGMAQFEFQKTWPSIASLPPDEALLRRLESPKLAELKQLLRSLVVDQGRKVVVFSQWRRMLKLAHWAVRDVLEEQGLRAAFFTGAESQRQRTRNIVELHDDDSTRVLFASDAGGVGLNLQRACSACVNLDLPWNPAVLEQRIGRIYRLGQKRPIDVFNLVSQDSIEERMTLLLSDKQQLFTGLFDGTSDEVEFERSGSFLEGVRMVVEAAELPVAAGGDGADEGEDAVDAELEAMVEAADESCDATGPADEPLRVPPAAELQQVLGQIAIQRRPDGGLRIEAPPEAAATLGALFEGFGRLLSQAAGDSGSRRD